MDKFVADFVSSMGLALPLAILVGIRAGEMIEELNLLNMDRKVTELAINVVKEKIIEELVILFRVYRETTVDVSLPTGVNLQAKR